MCINYLWVYFPVGEENLIINIVEIKSSAVGWQDIHYVQSATTVDHKREAIYLNLRTFCCTLGVVV